MTRSSKDIGLEFLQAFWDGEVDRGLALCADDAVWHFQKSLRTPRSAPIRDAVDWLNDTLVSGFDPESGYEVDLKNSIGEGDEAAIEYSAKGTTRSGEVYWNEYLVRFTVTNGKIVSVRPYFDTHYVHRRLVPLADNDNV